MRTMRRLVTLALALGLTALVAAAAVDTLRGEEVRRADPPTPRDNDTESSLDVRVTAPVPSLLEDREALAARLERNGVDGTLFLSADRCLDGRERRLRALDLSDLALTPGPQARSCPFTVSHDGGDASGPEATWSPRVRVFAAETGPDELVVIDVVHAGELTLEGRRPAFRPDGTLTYVRNRAVVAWTNRCSRARESMSPPIAFGPEQLGPYCMHTAISRRDLTRALPEGGALRAVDAVVWADDERALTVLWTGRDSWLAPFERGRRRGLARGLTSRVTTAPRADPTGRFVALTPGGYLEVYDRGARRVLALSIQPEAFEWSPDGEWLAYAAADNVFLVRTSDWTTRFSLPFSTHGIAWR